MKLSFFFFLVILNLLFATILTFFREKLKLNTLPFIVYGFFQVLFIFCAFFRFRTGIESWYFLGIIICYFSFYFSILTLVDKGIYHPKQNSFLFFFGQMPFLALKSLDNFFLNFSFYNSRLIPYIYERVIPFVLNLGTPVLFYLQLFPYVLLNFVIFIEIFIVQHILFSLYLFSFIGLSSSIFSGILAIGLNYSSFQLKALKIQYSWDHIILFEDLVIGVSREKFLSLFQKEKRISTIVILYNAGTDYWRVFEYIGIIKSLLNDHTSILQQALLFLLILYSILLFILTQCGYLIFLFSLFGIFLPAFLLIIAGRFHKNRDINE